jgi:GNAT superfamily N-acetyltransferase
MAETECLIRPFHADEREAFGRLVAEHWGAPVVISREVAHDVRALPGLIAIDAASDRWLGIASYRVEAPECELVLLLAIERGHGVGSALLDAVATIARTERCRRVWLTTTNDNLDAIRFYQRRGMRFVRVWRDAIARARKIKPEIPTTGDYGIPIVDEIEMELILE